MLSSGPGPWSLVLGPFGPDLGPDLDLTWDLDLDLSLTISVCDYYHSKQISSATSQIQRTECSLQINDPFLVYFTQ